MLIITFYNSKFFCVNVIYVGYYILLHSINVIVVE